jgi:acyl-CoA thioester hydrolase
MVGFQLVHRQEIVLRDLDVFGHVNNAVFLTLIENARVRYLREVLGVSTIAQVRNILASATINFRSPLEFGAVVEVGARVEHIGTKSFRFGHEIWDDRERLAADAQTVQVMFDFTTSRTIEVPREWRARIEAFEQAGSVASA